MFDAVDRPPQRERLSGAERELVGELGRNVERDRDCVVAEGFDVGDGEGVERPVAQRRTGFRGDRCGHGQISFT